MSASIPPYADGPAWTVTVEHGDVHITVRKALTPDESDRLAANILVASLEARQQREAVTDLNKDAAIESAPSTRRTGE